MEASRPKREFTEQVCQNRSKVGRPRVHHYEPAVLTNWANPLLFMTIDKTAERHKPLMSPIDIVRDLKKINPAQFGRLTPQVLGQWIDRSGESARWSDVTLERVRKGNSPGGVTTHVGVLVCAIFFSSEIFH
jgi:hypothetical protein